MSEYDDDEISIVETTIPMLEVEPEIENRRRERPREPCWKGETVKSIVYAGLDAIVTCFSLISSISASHLSSVDVLVLGIANLVADGISQSVGEFLSTSTKEDLASKEREVTEWDVNNHKMDKLEKLLQQYQNLGMDINDANMVVNILAKYDQILIEENVKTEKGMPPPDEQGGKKSWKNGLITFFSFVGFGVAPLLSFIILKPFTDNDFVMFIGACFMSALALALLGLARAKIAGKNYALSVGVVLLNGGVAAAAAYFLGWVLRKDGLDEPVTTKIE
ncbi:hypothetical protein COLO4_12632 [Corchorus olitorius]|uniref:Vacuolar iron transporter n=1 Tax=Corchorus olitorius TaxID=93759 RepID=A0A1R3K065_9ROSI|nr:hypothetical protein COLO4_12632 [Corchorus olitorius]